MNLIETVKPTLRRIFLKQFFLQRLFLYIYGESPSVFLSAYVTLQDFSREIFRRTLPVLTSAIVFTVKTLARVRYGC